MSFKDCQEYAAELEVELKEAYKQADAAESELADSQEREKAMRLGAEHEQARAEAAESALTEALDALDRAQERLDKCERKGWAKQVARAQIGLRGDAARIRSQIEGSKPPDYGWRGYHGMGGQSEGSNDG